MNKKMLSLVMLFFLATLVIPGLTPRAHANSEFQFVVQDVIEELHFKILAFEEGSKERKSITKKVIPIVKRLGKAIKSFEVYNIKGCLGQLSGAIKKMQKSGFYAGLVKSETLEILDYLIDNLETLSSEINDRMEALEGDNRKVAKLQLKWNQALALMQEAEAQLIAEDYKAFFKSGKSLVGRLIGVAKKLLKLERAR